MSAAVVVQRATDDDGPEEGLIREAVGAALAGRAAAGEVCVRIVDAAESAALNRRYRGKYGPTNVLSFPCDAPVAGAPLGDLAICAPVVVREAAEQGKAAAAHWSHLLVHGVLHLLGFDHIGEHEATLMEAEERAILARLGIVDPYAPIPAASPCP